MSASPARRRPIVWISGVGWDDVTGTDKRLVSAIGERHDVLWVDSPHRGHWRAWARPGPVPRTNVAPGVVRVRVPAPLGFARAPVRPLTELVRWLTLHRALPRGCEPSAVVVSNPLARFPWLRHSARILYLTDDWIAGSGLMGISEHAVTRYLRVNARHADAVAAITLPLLEQLYGLGLGEETPRVILPNGAPTIAITPGRREKVAGLVGQLNERLDLAALESIVDSDVRLLVVGPRADRDPTFSRRLENLLEREEVEWVGGVGPKELVHHLSRISVGLTPYTRSPFNDASFPLKTLEYLAAGIPVVSTDLPASRWLATDHVRIAPTSAEFQRLVRAALGDGSDEEIERSRVEFAASHDWTRRAETMLTLIDSVATAEP